ncbi:MAG: HAD-IA family hydrolase [Deltaproteobacteria bacterium]|nr:HAD-IA family hydrolase [Deltaproteobacteria bacterium]
MIKLVIWDLDGTLINSLPSTFAAMNDGIEARVGRRLSADELLANFGSTEDQVLARIVGTQHAQECYQKYVKSTEQRIREILPHQGILEVLDTLKAGNQQLSIFTGRARRTTDTILKNLSLEKYFSQVVAGDEVDRDKPHPEGVYKICKAAGISPSETLFVGDSHYDIASGRTAGSKTAAATWDVQAQRSREKLAAAMPSYFIAHPDELHELLQRR